MLMPKSLFRYHTDSNETAIAEKMIADYVGSKYAVAFNSCSSAIYISLLCAGVKQNDVVLMPAFTFTAVPSAIVNAGAHPVLVDITPNYDIDLVDLERQIKRYSAGYLLLSYIRGHVPNMKDLLSVCVKHRVKIIEDAAHGLGCKWKDRYIGTFGTTGCFSTQSAKIIDSGEGGFLVTDDEDVAAKAIFYAGSYENLWENHLVKPSDVAMISWQDKVPCFGLRMHNLTASLIIDQVLHLEETIGHVNKNYKMLHDILATTDKVRLPDFPKGLRMVGDTLQFELLEGDPDQVKEKTGLSYFGEKNNARAFWNWHYFSYEKREMKTDEIIFKTFDVRLQARLSTSDVVTIGNNILRAVK